MDLTLIQNHIIPKYQQIQYNKYKTKFKQGYLRQLRITKEG
jgi:hypothetical protein